MYGQQGVTVPHISQTQISTAMAGSRWPPYLYPAGLMTAGTQLSPHHSRFVPTPSHHSESPKVNNNGKTSEPSSGVTLNKQPPISRLKFDKYVYKIKNIYYENVNYTIMT